MKAAGAPRLDPRNRRLDLDDAPKDHDDATTPDALSEVLAAFRLSASLFFRVELRAPFAVTSLRLEALRADFAEGADHVLPFHLVTEGAIWFAPEGRPPVRLEEGDLIVLPRGTTHALVDRPGRTPVPVGALSREVDGRPPTLRHGGGGARAGALCGFFRCDGRLFNPLLDALPDVVVVRRDGERSPWLAAVLERAYGEQRAPRAGSTALVHRLAELLFVDVVQARLAESPRTGWLAGLADPVVGRALARMHAEPAREWTVDALARAAGASRTVLSRRFRALLGTSVMRYLAAWRMELAAGRLVSTDRSVAEIAAEVGYGSEAALNRAFKRHAGTPPAAWRRSRAGTGG